MVGSVPPAGARSSCRRSPMAHRVIRVGNSRARRTRGSRGSRYVHRGVPGAATTLASSGRPDTEVVFDPSTYVGEVPFEALARLRRETPVVWVAETPVLGWPEGSGFWLVLRHAEVESVLARPQLSLPRSGPHRSVIRRRRRHSAMSGR